VDKFRPGAQRARETPVVYLPNSRLSAIFGSPGSGCVQLGPGRECVTNLPNSRKSAIYWVVFRREVSRTGRPGNSEVESCEEWQNSAINISPGLLTDAEAASITRSCRMTASPKRKEICHFLYYSCQSRSWSSGCSSSTCLEAETPKLLEDVNRGPCTIS